MPFEYFRCPLYVAYYQLGHTVRAIYPNLEI